MDVMSIFNIIFLISLLILVIFKIFEAFVIFVLLPSMISKNFKKQGINGPKYRFMYGNIKEMKKLKKEAKLSILDLSSNDVFARVCPHYQHWISQYGETFLYWDGTEPKLFISEPELAKQVLLSKLGLFVKAKMRPEILKLIGMKGLVYLEGDDWAHHRKILNPAFSIDRLKVMTNVMVDCTLKMFEEWRKQKKNEENVMKNEMKEEFRRLTADIVATAAFGSSYTEGIKIFRSQEKLKKCLPYPLTNNIFIPGFRFLPKPSTFKIWMLEREIKNSIKKIVKSRIKSKPNYGDDLLGTMLKASESGKKMNIEEIIDECKTFFFTGHETTANLLTWTIMLLSLHQDWQEKVREEVFEECGKDKIPDLDTLKKLKLMNFVFLESLRLYGPIPFISRKASTNLKLGQIVIPEGTTVILPLLKIHTDKSIWGSDADKFNPTRFENGVSKAANHPNAFLAFSIGQRACIGKTFAMIEANTVLVMILQRFRFTLSGEYKHAPVDSVAVQPQFGLPVMFQPLED